MKFSHSIQFNAVPEWTSHYLAYDNLKKLIYTLEREVNQRRLGDGVDGEQSPLLGPETDDPNKVFTQALDREVDKIGSFYDVKEPEIYREVDALISDEEGLRSERASAELDGEGHSQSRKRAPSTTDRRTSMTFRDWVVSKKRRPSISSLERIDSGDGESDEDGEERSSLKKQKSRESSKGNPPSDDRKLSVDFGGLRRRMSAPLDDSSDQAMSFALSQGATLKKRMVSLYVELCGLRSFVQLNKTGFSKILKKYDKTLDKSLRAAYMAETIERQHAFKQDTLDVLNDRIQQLEQTYATLNTNGNLDQARRELRLDLREHVVWERNTVWREMIGIERKAQAANLGVRRTILESGQERKQGDEQQTTDLKEVNTPVGRYRLPNFLLHSSFYTLLLIIIIFLVLLYTPIMELPEQQNCLAMVILVSLLWATEAIPLFVTSLLVPFLCVILRIVRQDQPPHNRLASKAAAGYVFSAMWSPVIMLLLGGFTIAAALSKHNIAKMMATFVLSKAGTKPRNVLLASMFVSMFASMWISNVAAPVLCFSIIQPILRNLPTDSQMIKALLLGIALAANIGGGASPIASPQNLIALQNMAPEPGWGVWFFIALPVCIISIFFIWILLLVTLRPGRNTTIVPIRPMKDKFTGTQYFISIVTIITIVLWCVTHQLEFLFGDMGVVAIIPMVLFFGTGILTKEDFNNFLWTIIILAAGGLALGKAVNSSGLLHTLAEGVTNGVQGLSLYGVLVVFCAMIVVIASFISHTVAALIILPLVQQVGQGMAEPHPNLLVMGSVLMCSGAMALPTSGFPNMTAIMMEDPQTGQRYLQVKHFITRGVPASIIAFVTIITVGYGLMRAAGL